MKRALPIIVLCMLAAAAACADSTEGPRPSNDDNDASVQTPESDASPSEASPEGSTEAGREAGSRPTCNEDGWCLVSLPTPQPLGVKNFRVVGLAMEGPGKVWAATNSFTLGDGNDTSHLLRYENGSWTSAYGISAQQPGPFEYTLKAIAGNGAGSFMAVGEGSSWEVWPKPAIVLRIENGKIIEEHPEGLIGLAAVAFTNGTEAYALDNDGRVYRTTIGGAGPLVWTEQSVPHPAGSGGWPRGPKMLFVSTDGKLILGGEDSSQFPSPKYLDRQTDDGSWVTAILPDPFFDLAAGVSVAPDAVWVTGPYFIGGKELPTEALDAGPDAEAPDAGEPVWSTVPSPYPEFIMRSLWARSANDIWAAGYVGRVFHFDGTTWTDAKPALDGTPMTVEWLSAVTGWPSTGEVWVGGDAVMHYTPKGTP
jgi:hypothetical protein